MMNGFQSPRRYLTATAVVDMERAFLVLRYRGALLPADIDILEQVALAATRGHFNFIPKSLRPQVERSSKGIDAPWFEKHLDGEGHPWASVARSS